MKNKCQTDQKAGPRLPDTKLPSPAMKVSSTLLTWFPVPMMVVLSAFYTKFPVPVMSELVEFISILPVESKGTAVGSTNMAG